MQATTHPVTADIEAYVRREFTGRPSRAALFEAIVEACAEPMARYGIHEVTFTRIARAMQWGRGAVAHRFNAPHSIAAVIVLQHLSQLRVCMDMIPAETPNRATLIRAIYRKAVREEDGSFTSAHRLLLRDEWQLHPKTRARIAEYRAAITAQLARPGQETLALALLDTESMPHEQLEATLAATEAAPTLSRTNPEPALPQGETVTAPLLSTPVSLSHQTFEPETAKRLHTHVQTPNRSAIPTRLAA